MTTTGDIETLREMIGASAGNTVLKRLILERLRTVVGAAAVQIFSQDVDFRGGDYELGIGTEPEKMDAFRRVAARRNVLFTPERAELFVPGTVLLSHEVMSQAEMERSELYREVLHPHVYLMAVPLARYDTSAKGLGFQRERSQRPFGERERQIMKELAYHLVEAERDEHSGRLAALVADAQAEIFYLQPCPVVLVSDDARVLAVNQSGEEVLRQSQSPLLLRGGRLCLSPRCTTQVPIDSLIRIVASLGIPRSLELHRQRKPLMVLNMRRIVPSPLKMVVRNPVVALYLNAGGGDADVPRRIVNTLLLQELDDTEREMVSRMVSTSVANKQIAASMGFTSRAFEKRVQRIARKLKIPALHGQKVRPILTSLLVSK